MVRNQQSHQSDTCFRTREALVSIHAVSIRRLRTMDPGRGIMIPGEENRTKEPKRAMNPQILEAPPDSKKQFLNRIPGKGYFSRNHDPAPPTHKLSPRTHEFSSRIHEFSSRMHELSSRTHELSSRIYELSSRTCEFPPRTHASSFENQGDFPWTPGPRNPEPCLTSHGQRQAESSYSTPETKLRNPGNVSPTGRGTTRL